MTRALMIPATAALLLSGCYLRTLHEPARCGATTVDTVNVLLVNGRPAGAVLEENCDLWVAFSDSTMCWNGDGERLAACP